MKKVLSILLALLIISQMMVNVGIGIYYHINKDYITQQLCINKSNPALHCNGRCYLAKQLQKAENGEKQSSQALKERNEIFSTVLHDIVISYFPDCSIGYYTPYAPAESCADNFKSIIKPPETES